jgi:hypothetical protein
MKTLFILFSFLAVVVQCQYSTITATGTHIASNCQLFDIVNEGQNWFVFGNATSFPTCPDPYIAETQGPYSEHFACIVSNTTFPLNYVVTSTYNLQVLSQITFANLNTYTTNFDTFYGMTNVSLVGMQENIFGDFVCWNDTAQTIPVYGAESCIGIPDQTYYFTYCGYGLMQSTIDGVLYLRSVNSIINFFDFAYFIPGVWNSTQTNFMFTTVMENTTPLIN